MTDAERHALSERIATLAEQAGLPKQLLWDPAAQCPQGHRNNTRQGINCICDKCVYHRWKEQDWNNGQFMSIKNMIRYMEAVPNSVGQQWRIGKEAKDFTNPTYLYPLVQAWIDGDPAYRYIVIRWDFGLGEWECVMKGTQNSWGVARGLDRSIVEARAFAEALEKGVEK